MMAAHAQNSNHRIRSLLTAALATLPVLVSLVAGFASPEAHPLNRTATPRRPLQFAQYCVNHGRDPVTHTSTLTSYFRFRNVGAETIRLGEVERSCGCLTPELSHDQLEPGASGEMKVSVPLADQNAGFHEFQLTVHYSDSEPRHETVLIKAVFPKPRIHVTPRAMDISQTGSTDRPMTHHFTIADHRSQPLKVTTVESSSPWIHGGIQSVEDNGRVTRVAMEIQADMPPGTHRVLVHALTDDRQFPAAVMPIRITGPARSEPVTVVPSRLRMRADDTRAQAVQMLIPAVWEVSHVECFPDELLCEWQIVPDGATAKQQRVELALMMSEPPASRAREGVVTLYANDSTEMVTVSVEILDGRRPSGAHVAVARHVTRDR
ncbi:MAG: DUF1573 domain-containing protein [Planctomycetaceae bacterium]